MPESELNAAGSSDRAGHISVSDLAGFIDGDLVPAERSRVEAHIESCAECRAELIETRRITNGYAGRARRHHALRRWWVPATAAAGLAALALGSRLLVQTPQPRPMRSSAPTGEGEGRAHIDIVSPSDNASVVSDGITFVWHSAAADVYRISVLSESGEPVWTAETPDTTFALPRGIALRSGTPYFWRVEAISNGITATTGAHRLQIAP